MATNKRVYEIEFRGLSEGTKQLDAYEGQLKDVSKAEQKFSKENKKTQKEVQNYTHSMDGLKNVTGELGQQFGNEVKVITAFGKTIKSAGQGALTTAKNIGTITSVTKAASVGFKLLKTAIISTGIGAVVVGLTSLVAFLTKTQRGLDLVARAGAGFNAGFSVIVDRLSGFGEKIVTAFENPKQAIIDFGQSIITNIANRFTALPNVIQNALKVIRLNLNPFGDKEELDKAKKDLRTSFIQLTTGLSEDQQKKAKDAIKGIRDEINNEVKASIDLKRQEQALVQQEIDLILLRASTEKEIAKARAIAADKDNVSAQDRIVALEKAAKLEQQLADKEVEFAQNKADIFSAQVALGESLNDELIEEARLRAGIDVAITKSFNLQKKLTAELLTARRELAKSQVAINNEQQAKINESNAEWARIADDRLKFYDEERKKRRDAEEKDKEDKAQAELERIEAEEQARQELRVGALSVIDGAIATAESNQLKRAEGNEKKQEEIKKRFARIRKIRAIAETIVNTARSIARVSWNPILVALTAAIGAAQVAIISAQKLAKGGIVKGASHDQGGVPIMGGKAEVEGGEGIINKMSMSSSDYMTVSGTPRQIASQINSHKGYGIKFQQGGVVPYFNSQLQPNIDLTSFSDFVRDSINTIRVENVATQTQRVALRVQNIEGEASL